jgi:protoporphyrinogen/coproporphyrinogen III oxidase
MNTESTDNPKVAIVGAGIAGLAAAYELQKSGIQADVFESSDRAGGRMVTEYVGPFPFDAGADFFAESYHQIKAYANEFEIPWNAFERHSFQRILRGKTAHVLHLRGISDMTKIKLLGPISTLRLLKWAAKFYTFKQKFDFFDLSSIPEEYDNETAAEYLHHEVGDEINDYIVDPFTGAMHFHRTDEISAGVLLALAQAIISPAKDFSPRYTQGGMMAVVMELKNRVPVNYNVNIRRVTSNDSGVEIEFIDGNVLQFDKVIMATPAPITKKLISNPSDALSSVLASAEYASTITVGITVPSHVPDDSACTYVPFVENPAIASYTFESNKSASFEHDGRCVVNVYLREQAAKQLLSKTDDEVFKFVIDQMPQVCPELMSYRNEIKPLKTYRWPLAMPKFKQKFVSNVRSFVNHHQGENGIFLAGDYLNSPWTEGAARCGVRVAQLIKDSEFDSTDLLPTMPQSAPLQMEPISH